MANPSYAFSFIIARRRIHFNRDVCDPEDFRGDARQNRRDAGQKLLRHHAITGYMVHLLARDGSVPWCPSHNFTSQLTTEQAAAIRSGVIRPDCGLVLMPFSCLWRPPLRESEGFRCTVSRRLSKMAKPVM